MRLAFTPFCISVERLELIICVCRHLVCKSCNKPIACDRGFVFTAAATALQQRRTLKLPVTMNPSPLKELVVENAQRESHCSRFFTVVTAPFTVQSTASTSSRPTYSRVLKCFSPLNMPCWATACCGCCCYCCCCCCWCCCCCCCCWCCETCRIRCRVASFPAGLSHPVSVTDLFSRKFCAVPWRCACVARCQHGSTTRCATMSCVCSTRGTHHALNLHLLLAPPGPQLLSLAQFALPEHSLLSHSS